MREDILVVGTFESSNVSSLHWFIWHTDILAHGKAKNGSRAYLAGDSLGMIFKSTLLLLDRSVDTVGYTSIY